VDTQKDWASGLAWRGLIILTAVNFLSFVDKQTYAMLANMIGKSLKLSDLHLGVAQGLGFSGFFVLGTIFFGWAVDRLSRRSGRLLISAGVLTWSLAAAACGLATSFAGLFAARSIVGFCEALVLPAAIPILASTFPRQSLSMAVGIFVAGANLGGLFGISSVGLITQQFVTAGSVMWPLLGRLEPWQAVFIVTGLPGVVVSLLVFGIPIRCGTMQPADLPALPIGSQISMIQFVRDNVRFVAGVVLSMSLLTLLTFAMMMWAPAHFERELSWDHTKVGLVTGLSMGAGGIGNVLWGWLADRLRNRGMHAALINVYICLCLAGLPFLALTFGSANSTVVTICYPLTWIMLNSYGPLYSATQLGIPDHLRGRLIGLQAAGVGVIGLVGGPILVSLLDRLFFSQGSKLGESILISATAADLAAVALMIWVRPAFRNAVMQREWVAAPAQ
jgi:MFS family permease